MPLTDVVCKSAKPTDKPRKLADAHGLYLEVTPNGGKYWRLKYRFGGKEKRLAIGVYPETSLAEAREKRAEARKLLAANIDPSQAKKEEKRQTILKYENTFEVMAREWHENQKGVWTERHAYYVLRRLETDIFPALSARPMSEITASELLAVLRLIEERGAIDLAHRALQTCGQVFRYAIVTGKAERDVSADLRGALKTKKAVHHAHIQEHELPEFLERLDSYEGLLQTKLALKLLLLTFVRTTELRAAQWSEINFGTSEWRIPAERMKMRQLHIVPLSKQAIVILEALKSMNGHSSFIFPNHSNSKKCMSENTVLFALYRMGYHSRATGHGFRSTASTILNETGFRSDVIERQLAHGERNKVRASYNHAEYLPERRKMMQHWADYLEGVAESKSNVVVGKFGGI
jgi:integrase